MDAGSGWCGFLSRAIAGALLGVVVGTVVGAVINVVLAMVVMPLNRDLGDAGNGEPWMLFIFTAVFAGPSAAVGGAAGAASRRPAVGLVTGLVVSLLASLYPVGLLWTYSDFGGPATIVEIFCFSAGIVLGPAAAGALAGSVHRPCVSLDRL
jgi:hypothetical protein